MAVLTPTPTELRQLDFFNSLSEGELADLSSRARLVRLESGQSLFLEGEPIEAALRFVYTGGIQIRKTAASGKETVLRLIRQGELFGVAALFDRKLAPGSAIASESTQVLEIPIHDMMAHLSGTPEIALKLLITFAQRLRESQDTLHMVISGRAKTRLARLILTTMAQDGALPGPEGYRLKTKLPHATMSRMVGITYEECVRLIRDWSHDPEILHYERGGIITVGDRSALERQAEDE